MVKIFKPLHRRSGNGNAEVYFFLKCHRRVNEQIVTFQKQRRKIKQGRLYVGMCSRQIKVSGFYGQNTATQDLKVLEASLPGLGAQAGATPLTFEIILILWL